MFLTISANKVTNTTNFLVFMDFGFVDKESFLFMPSVPYSYYMSRVLNVAKCRVWPTENMSRVLNVAWEWSEQMSRVLNVASRFGSLEIFVQTSNKNDNNISIILERWTIFKNVARIKCREEAKRTIVARKY